MTKITYEIGQLVAIRNHPYFEILEGNSNKKNFSTRYVGNTITCSSDNFPLMIVKEYTQSIEKKMELNSENSTFSEISRLKTKYLCVWYDSKLGRFQEAWFYPESLVIFTGISDSIKDSELADISMFPIEVYLRTTIIERYKTIKNQARENDRFVSSSFLIKGKKTENQFEWINEKYDFKERLISKTKIKVQWFNVAKGKYSEEWLPIEFFKKTPDLMKIDWTYLDPDKKESFEKNGYRKLMEYLNNSNRNYFFKNSLSGQNLESLIFYYLANERKIILDDRVHAFDRYLEENKYKVIKYKISVNSEEIEHFHPFYAPVDLIVKSTVTDELFAVDLISGNSLISDGQIKSQMRVLSDESMQTNDEESDDVCQELSLYNGRAYIIQKLLIEKYGYKNIKAKLLVINSGLNNIIKEFDVSECPVSLSKVIG
ncbi:hypothetical protein [Gaoshiqia sediminis]|uniref:Uncharacterized protein n=1 Tax=Gaoshiqia sediminis TaxID=2986998 RepID=A0AA42C8I5_9BACT|nr:hypothetical protein [Gaoshiqia sediminis]MCW0484759.1 hypothetical protein [Gaoshiqia sediminis]